MVSYILNVNARRKLSCHLHTPATFTHWVRDG